MGRKPHKIMKIKQYYVICSETQTALSGPFLNVLVAKYEIVESWPSRKCEIVEVVIYGKLLSENARVPSNKKQKYCVGDEVFLSEEYKLEHDIDPEKFVVGVYSPTKISSLGGCGYYLEGIFGNFSENDLISPKFKKGDEVTVFRGNLLKHDFVEEMEAYVCKTKIVEEIIFRNDLGIGYKLADNCYWFSESILVKTERSK